MGGTTTQIEERCSYQRTTLSSLVAHMIPKFLLADGGHNKTLVHSRYHTKKVEYTYMMMVFMDLTVIRQAGYDLNRTRVELKFVF